jgi:protoheme IX farnesyltransferase
MGHFYDFGVLLKPKVTLAMLGLFVASYLTSTRFSGEGINLFLFFIGFIAVIAAVSGANVLNCYFDKDIDSIMARTSGRPLVTGSIGSSGALSFSGLMIFTASALAFSLGPIPVLFLLTGFGSYVWLYTILLKRKTIWNVFANAPSVAAPAWFGWYLGGATFFPVGFLMGFIVALWGPLHLWGLAFAFSKDYKRVGVPMFPTVVSIDIAINGILVSMLLLIASSYLLFVWARTYIFLICVTFLNLPLFLSGIKLYKEKSRRVGWWLFKITAPYIILLFFLFMFNQLVLYSV